MATILSPQLIQYIMKSLIGTSVCYLLYISFPSYPFYWSMISVAVVISAEHKNNLAFDRMKANILGSVTGFGLYFIPISNFLQMLIGVILVIYVGTVMKLQNAVRTALAALIVVLIKQETGKEGWVALSRVVCVVAGCVVALAVTLAFTYYSDYARSVTRKKQNN